MSRKKAKVFESAFKTYKAEGIIGDGGSSSIFRAIDDSGEKWAVKLLDSARATAERRKRFKNELFFCLRSKHPNIVTVVDHGVFVSDTTHTPFYVMPLYQGSMRSLLKTGMVHDKALKYYANVLDGIEAAHLQGVVHRDLKPENVLYDAKRDVLLVADFGIAHFGEDELLTAVETKDTTRLANFQYAAPEQRARGSKVDLRADIYALGLILNEMFTGHVPSGTGYKTIAQVAADYAYLDDLVTCMLSYDPKDRFGSIEEVKTQLIGRRNEFVTRQRLSELKSTVVPVTELDDPLISDPLHLTGFDWDKGTLMLHLNQPVNDKWIWALRHIGSYSCLLGKGHAAATVAEKLPISGGAVQLTRPLQAATNLVGRARTSLAWFSVRSTRG